MKIERRLVNTEFETRAQDGKASQVVGYGAVFDSLSENLGGFREKIAPGAFDGALDDDIRGLINHDSNLILGRSTAGTLRVSTDDHGLRYEIDLPDTTYARDLSVSMQRGDISQSSFGFFVDEDDWIEDEDGLVIRTIKKVRQLLDVSPVTFPAYPAASSEARSEIEVDDAGLKKHQAQQAEVIQREHDCRERVLQMKTGGV